MAFFPTSMKLTPRSAPNCQIADVCMVVYLTLTQQQQQQQARHVLYVDITFLSGLADVILNEESL